LEQEVVLVVEEGAQKGQTFRLRSEETIVGRRRGCKLRIPSESVSRRHCRLMFREDFLTVEDLASVNGTRVNGQLIAKPTIVHPGDCLTIGVITFRVQYQLTLKAIERLMEEKQKEMELLPTFDANDSSLPVALPEKKAHLSVPTKPRKPAKRKPGSGTTKKLDGDEKNPDASAVLDGGNWQLPSRQDIRDILSGLEE
jgi:pSer/pThr/pTyr-binding forkhead associated (FHA) protein